VFSWRNNSTVQRASEGWRAIMQWCYCFYGNHSGGSRSTSYFYSQLVGKSIVIISAKIIDNRSVLGNPEYLRDPGFFETRENLITMQNLVVISHTVLAWKMSQKLWRRSGPAI